MTFIYYSLAIIVPFNGLTNLFLGELASEALVLFVGVLYFLVTRMMKTRLIILIILTLYVIIENLVYLFYINEEIRILFAFPLIFLLLLACSERQSYKSAVPKITSLFVYCAWTSAIFAVSQRLGFTQILPLEGELRATGLSRSSLNLTGVLFAALAVVVLQSNQKFGLKRIISIAILLSGLIAAGGRGGIISGILLITLTQIISSRTTIKFKIMLILALLSLIMVAGDYFIRAFSAFNFGTDQSNLDRLNTYLLFTKYFNVWGVGLGATSPAAGRFIDVVGFESTILNLVHEIGLITFILICSTLLFYYLKADKEIRIRFAYLVLAMVPLIVGQQLYQIPSAFVALVFSIDLIVKQRMKT